MSLLVELSTRALSGFALSPQFSRTVSDLGVAIEFDFVIELADASIAERLARAPAPSSSLSPFRNRDAAVNGFPVAPSIATMPPPRREPDAVFIAR